MGEGGLSTIVATVLIVMLVVAGVAIVWVGVLPIIKRNSVFQGLDIQVNIFAVSGYAVYDSGEDVLAVRVEREVDNVMVDRMRISFIVDGESVSSSFVALVSGGVQTYVFNFSGYDKPESVGVAPIFVLSGGEMREGTMSSMIKVRDGVINLAGSTIYKVGGNYYKIPTSGLVSWWKFNGGFTDSVGGNDGTAYGNAQIINNELVLDGAGDYVDVGKAESLNPLNFTLSVWIYRKSYVVSTSQYIIGDMSDNPPRNGSWLRVDYSQPDKIDFLIASATGFSKVGTTDVISINTWYHVVGTYDGATLRLYLNGVLNNYVSSSIVIGSPAAYNTYIGRLANANLYFFNGTIDDVMIFNRSLSADEIFAISETQKVERT